MSAPDEECGNCKFFKSYHRGNGYCRRYPPHGGADRKVLEALSQIHWVISKGGEEHTDTESMAKFDPDFGINYSEFPYMAEYDWCGEHKPRLTLVATGERE